MKSEAGKQGLQESGVENGQKLGYRSGNRNTRIVEYESGFSPYLCSSASCSTSPIFCASCDNAFLKF
jgi:hypothetical protein